MFELYTAFLQTIDATFRLSTPLILASMAGLLCERSGIINIGLEGKMLGSAFAAAAVASLTGSVWLGMLSAMTLGVILALLHGLACITYRGDQIISGVAINMLMSGFTVLMSLAIFSTSGTTPQLSGEARFNPIGLPFAEVFGKIPVLGPIYQEVISGHTFPVYAAFLSVGVVAWVLYRTTFGLHLRAVGENAQAVETAGISVYKTRYMALVGCGILCGISGSYLSTAQNAQFLREMSAGQGYMALAALIFGKWRPRTTLFGCLLFGFLDALSVRLQGTSLPYMGEIPVQLIQVLPYLLTVVLLAGFIGNAIAPKNIGQPYEKQAI